MQFNQRTEFNIIKIFDREGNIVLSIGSGAHQDAALAAFLAGLRLNGHSLFNENTQQFDVGSIAELDASRAYATPESWDAVTRIEQESTRR